MNCDHCEGEMLRAFPSGGEDRICEKCYNHYCRPQDKDESWEDYCGRHPHKQVKMSSTEEKTWSAACKECGELLCEKVFDNKEEFDEELELEGGYDTRGDWFCVIHRRAPCVYCSEPSTTCCDKCNEEYFGSGRMCEECVKTDGKRVGDRTYCHCCYEQVFGEEEEAKKWFDRKYPDAKCYRCDKKVTGETVVECGDGCETWYCGDCHEEGTYDCPCCGEEDNDE